MKSVYKSLLPLFIGMALISCAGTDSSAQKKGEAYPNLFKAGTPVADSLVSKMQDFAHSIFKGTLDSIPGEYYCHVTDGRIDTLFKKEGGQYKPIISIDYDFLIGQDSYELKKGNYSYFVVDGILVAEEDFPKYSKAYWNNGNTKGIATGNLYKDNQGNTALDSGHVELYFENGKNLEQNDWKDKQVVAGKEWNENGVLIWELDFPNYSKEYWDNGNPQNILTGILYRDDQNGLQVDSGRVETYFENGKIQQQNDWKGKQLVAHKEWNENGVLTKEINLPKHYKEYWDNGKQKGKIIGILYRNDQGVVSADSGYSETYFENEKIHQHNEWRDKQIVAQKEWNENGDLIKDIAFPGHLKEYWDNKNLKQTFTGRLYRENNLCHFKPDSGHTEIYFENGKTKEQTDWKNKQVVTSKIWNENGVLIKELDFPKSIKEYWDNGKPKMVLTGLFYRDNQGDFVLDSGRQEFYFENGKIHQQNDWKNKLPVASKEWNDNGVLIKELDFPKHIKEYWSNGKIKQAGTGLLYRDDEGAIKVDSGRWEFYFENGKIHQQNDWKNKLPIASKEWNDNGVLIKELDFPKHIKEYWSNGKIKQTGTGLLYRDDQGGFHLDSGHSEIYFENGEIQQKADWKGKLPITQKEWNKNGVLIKEFVFPKHFKEYWDNGKPKQIMTGILYRENQSAIKVDSGHSEIYYESGKIKENNDWKNKQLVASKVWNRNGVLIKEIDFPKYLKEYWNNEKPKFIMTGSLYRDNQGGFSLDSGHTEFYSENGKINEQNDRINKQFVTSKVWNEKGILVQDYIFPKYAKYYWDNGKPKAVLTGLLYRDDQGAIRVDSGHSEIYYESGKIKENNDWKNKQLIASKVWNENGILTKEIEFPRSLKKYWDNGKIKETGTGLLYRDDQDNIAMDSGHSELYYENGKIHQQNDWKNKQPATSKQWNEKGTLIKDIDFPKYYKEYWNNGKPKAVLTGILYRDDQDNFYLDSGHAEIYFENGKIQQKNDWKNKLPIAIKQWNENGVLIKDIAFPKHLKDYWDNGKIKQIAVGALYRADQGDIRVDSGRSEIYFENGKIKEQNRWKNKQTIKSKIWNEKGILVVELDFPKSFKMFWDNGKPKAVLMGSLYRDDQGNFELDSGHSEIYFENGNIHQQKDWKDKQLVAHKEWNENGILSIEFDITKGYFKQYNENGTIYLEMNGSIYIGTKGVLVENGYAKWYYQNGKLAGEKKYKDKKLISGKNWREDGSIMTEGDVSKGIHKEYYPDGKITQDVSGKFHYDDHGNIILEQGSEKQWLENGNLYSDIYFPKYAKIYSDKGNLDIELEGKLFYDDKGIIAVQDGFRKEYNDNGQLALHQIYKGKKLIIRKTWHENGAVWEEGDASREFHKEYDPDGKIYRGISGKFHYDDDSQEVILENAAEKWWNKKGILTTEIVFPKYAKSYSDSETLKTESEGTLYYDEQKKIQIQDGTRKSYYSRNGKLAQHIVYKGKKLVSKTEWNKNGTVIISAELPNRYREFYDDGKIKAMATGIIVEEDGSFKIKDGKYNEYDQDGKVTYSAIYKNFQRVFEN